MLSGRRTAIARLALVAAVVVQLTDGLTFAAGLRSGVPLQTESNPIARDLYGSFGIVGVFDLKLIGVALVIVVVAVAQCLAPRRVVGWRRVLIAMAVVAIGGFVGTVANLSVLLPQVRVA